VPVMLSPFWIIFSSTFFLSIFPLQTPVTCWEWAENTIQMKVHKDSMRFIKVFSRCMDVLTEKDNNNCLVTAAFLWSVVVNTYCIIIVVLLSHFIGGVLSDLIKNPGFNRGYFLLKILLFILDLFEHFFNSSFQLRVFAA
jgi:hypothetical protein